MAAMPDNEKESSDTTMTESNGTATTTANGTTNNDDKANTTNTNTNGNTDTTANSNTNTNANTNSSTDNAAQCSSPNCTKPAGTLKCPICIKMNLRPMYFCSQDCFKRNYKYHNTYIHGTEKARIERENGLKTFKVPQFDYTGELRPSFVTAMRSVPSSIGKPDYWQTGVPRSEMIETRKGRKNIPIYTAADISGIRLACKLGREVLDIAGNLVRPGITTDEIDYHVHQACLERDCYPSPLNYNHFPKSCCTSVNEVICHGIPDSRELKNGDIVNIDITVYKNGYHGDLNETFLVGEVDKESKNLVKVTYEAMMNAIKNVKPGVFCRKYGEIIDDYVRKHKYSVVRTYCGHGIGKLFHCNPNIPHYRKNKAVGKLKPGMVFTIEPMINMGNWQDKLWQFDDWTAVTVDGKRSAQFEHTVVVTSNGCEILTARTPNSVPFWWDQPNNDTSQTNENKE